MTFFQFGNLLATFPVRFSTSLSQSAAAVSGGGCDTRYGETLGEFASSLGLLAHLGVSKNVVGTLNGWLGVERIPCQRYSQMLLGSLEGE